MNFGLSERFHGHMLKHLLGEIHHPVVVFVGYIDFHCSKFWIVCAIHSFVAEVSAKFIHPVESANDQALQIQFIRNTQVHGNVERVVMCYKRTCRSSSRYRLKHGSINFQISFVVEEIAHSVHNLGALHKGVFHFRIHNKIYVAHAVTQFRIGERVVYISICICLHHWKWLQRFR